MSGRTKILVVDDDAGMLDSLVLALEDEFEIVTAGNGQEALDAMARATVDVVLLDLMMPVLDGEGYLREHARRYPAIPVLLVSAERDLASRAASLGGREYLSKPFVLTELEEKLRRLAGGGAPAGGSSGSGPGDASSPAGGGGGAARPPKQARRCRPRPAADFL